MMLEVNNLEFSYKNHRVLNGIDFSAESGMCICLLGENGAGKTTLFRCLLGLLRDYKGSIYIGGADARRLSVSETAKKIAYIPQAHEPTFNYTVFETVLMGTNILINRLSSPGNHEHDIVLDMLELMGIGHLADRGYAEISGGERQLALIARALAQKSRILIMDEPTANLDYGNQFRVMMQVKKLAEKGYLVILSTHNPEHALLFADKVLVIKSGRTEIFGEPGYALSPDMIQNIYGISVEMQTFKTKNGDVPMVVPQFS